MKLIRIALLLAAPLSAQVTINSLPSREFGQALLTNPVTSSAPNLVEGREFSSPSGIAFDYSVTPPSVYISDTANNRVLGWKNANNLTKGNFADVVIGQHDLSSTTRGGPGTSASTGLSVPTGLAVDSKGNVYVIDSGNNRILRFPAPVSNGSFPNLVIGQASFSSGSQPNQGLNPPSAKTLFFSVNGTTLQAGLAFDSQGNLWATDAGNNRVLRYPAATLAAGAQQPAADIVLGQIDFISNQGPQSPNNTQTYKYSLVQPSSVTFDASGRLYVADAFARVLEFPPNPSTFQQADRVLGIRPTPSGGQQPTPYPSQYTLGLFNSSGNLAGAPSGVFALGNNLFVCDTPNSRVVWYDVYGSWSAETSSVPSPQEIGVLGQTSFLSGATNQGLGVPSGFSLAGPVAGAVNTTNNELWIVDTGNNRVLVFSASGSLVYTTQASRLLGQLDFPYSSPNLIEGREVWFYGGFAAAAMVVDKNSNPPRLYIADTNNNRVLGFKDDRLVGTDARTILNQKADLVIGQPSLLYAVVNYNGNVSASGVAGQPSATGLNHPVGLVVDANGNLYVADAGNGRVLRFPSPFNQPASAPQTANLVLGQSSFTTQITDPSQATLNTPYGLAQFNDGSLAVSDLVHNRILIFTKPSTGDFSNGMAASAVIGQSNFFSTQAGTSTSNLSGPRHIGVDSSNRLFVADTANNRLLAFTAAARLTNGASAALQVGGLNQPQGVAVSLLTGESWVANTNSNLIYRFPEFQTLQATLQSTDTLGSPAPLAVALDQFDNLIVGEGINRVSFYFPQMYYRHAASYAAGVGSTANPAPGMLALLARYGSNFNLAPAPIQSLPWPPVLNDIQVLVNGVASPIYFMDTAVIHFQIPMSTPDSGTADFVVQTASTGQILAAGSFAMQTASPGIFTSNQAGTGQVAANNTNPDGSAAGINSPQNALTAKGGIITLWLTGQGKVSNPPADGVAPGGNGIPTILTPTVLIGGVRATVLFSGLPPQYPGLWQINAVVPSTTLPASNVPVVVLMGDYQSNIGGNPSLLNGGPAQDLTLLVTNNLITTMAVK